MSEPEPSVFRPAGEPTSLYGYDWSGGPTNSRIVTFTRAELRNTITI